MFRLEIEGSPEDVEANLAMIEELLAGIDFGLLSNPILDHRRADKARSGFRRLWFTWTYPHCGIEATCPLRNFGRRTKI
ncbi:MAG: hypothetical protein R2839_08775 [Thermomicrobiales bacterium]